MTTRITLTTPQTAVVAGFQFEDGITEVATLGDNARQFFTDHGATIEELSPEGVSLQGMTKIQLVEFAAAQVPPIELPSTHSLKVGEVRALVIEAVESRASAPVASAGVVTTPIVGPETAVVGEAVESAPVEGAHEAAEHEGE